MDDIVILEEFGKKLFEKLSDLNLQKLINVAPLIQGTWRSNDYVSAFKLVNTWFYEMDKWACYIPMQLTNLKIDWHKHM